MKYFALEHSKNKKILGRFNQCSKILHNCHVDNEPNFIDRHPFEKIEFTPILSTLVLDPKSKITDLIKVSSTGFSFGSVVISEKLKNIFEGLNCYGLQFFATHLLQDNDVINRYWQTHIYDSPFQYVDFEKSKFTLMNTENSIAIEENIRIHDVKEFINQNESLDYPKKIIIKNIVFKENFDLDYFLLRYLEKGGNHGIVSEKLKNEIENQGITGIEFRPIEISFQDWLRSDEREKIYGKV